MRLQYFLILSLLISCSFQKEDQGTQQSDSVADISVTDSVAVKVNQFEETTVSQPQNTGITILFTGTFHGDEVSEGADQLNWLGLFYGDDGNYVLRKTTIITERVVDALVDNEEAGEKTGWEVKTESGEDVVILVQGGDLKEGRVEGASAPSTLYPGDSAEFEFKGVQYLMYATGERQFDSLSGSNQVRDYSLHVVRTHKGKITESILASNAAYDDAVTSILWSGDLDGDNFIDFIIDLSDHYNVSAPVLFLSKPAGDTAVAVPVAEHRTVGC